MSAPAFERDAALGLWSEAERRAALSPVDLRAVDSTASLRATILDFALRDGQDEELYDACASLGRILGDSGTSATLAATTIDRACSALGRSAPSWAPAARAALAEGFTRALVERARQAGHASWDYPACSVRLDGATVAIAAGHPSTDEETLAAWAAHAARGAARDGFRRAVLSGPDLPRAALVDALSIVGIGVI